jgi:aldehyde:ferredoxin oxidoreductase
MSSQTVSVDPFPEEWKLLGGRALSARILLEECDPSCDPLGPDNVLVMAPGVLSGTSAPTSGRISIGGKSPLTGGIKEANAGGNPGQDLMKLGYRAVVVKGQPADPDKRYAVDVDSEGGSVKEVPDCKGLWNYALIEQLAGRYPKTASFISIGPAGELRLTGASVACTDQEQDRHPARHAARGGLGAVMGSKGLKYVAVDPGRSSLRQPANRKEFTTRAKQYTKDYLAGDQMFKTGTSTVVPVANMLQTFPHKNRVEGQSPDMETLNGARIIESFETRGGGMHNCMTGCIVKCSNVVHDAEGNYKTSALARAAWSGATRTARSASSRRSRKVPTSGVRSATAPWRPASVRSTTASPRSRGRRSPHGTPGPSRRRASPTARARWVPTTRRD